MIEQANYIRGDRVYFNDPDDGISSGFYTVAETSHRDAEIIWLKNDQGSECQALPDEVERLIGPVHPAQEVARLHQLYRELAPAIYMTYLEASGYRAAQDKVQEEIDAMYRHPVFS